MTLQHNIDQIILRDGQIFAYGWGFVPGAAIERLTLRLEFESGTFSEIDAKYGQQRDDVKAAFAGINEAENAGFLVLAGLGGRSLAHAALHWELQDQKELRTVLNLPQSEVQAPELARFGYYKMLLRKAVTLFRAAGLRALWRKCLSYFSNRPREAKPDEWAQLRRETAGRALCVIVDHDMGGGSNIYRNEVIAQRRRTGEMLLLLGFHVATLQYFVEIFDDAAPRRYSVAQLRAVLPLAASGNVRQIIYNCAVSFRAPLQVPELLMALRQQSGAPLLFLLHDYFAICPSHILMDAEGAFCGVPEQGVCDDCLARHRDGFVSLSGIRKIGEWRDKWWAVLARADEIRVFSKASRMMLRRAYPSLDETKIQLVPHTLYTQLAPLAMTAGDGLHIGVVGAIAQHKGAGVVAALAVEILRRKAAVKISVIGTLDTKVPPGVVQVSGPYDATQLPTEIRKSGANIFLFPSIWGETFSYTVHELIAMRLPFACFDFGAQADLARQYEQGLVLKSMDAPDILDRLQEFWRSSYSYSEITR